MPEDADQGALFERLGDGHWQPTGYARGPWSPDALHGGPVAALLAGVLEATAAAAADPDAPMHPARLSVELLRPVPMAPLSTVSEVVRPGRKVRLTDCALSTDDGHVVATARLLQIRLADVPSAPVTTGVEGPAGPEGIGRSRPADVELHFHSHAIEHRFVSGGFGHFGPATDWMRLLVPVVAGEAPTPLQRVAAAADFGNGISRVADWNLLLFVNPDLTVHLHRVPAGEWVCLDAVTWMEPHGTALAESRLWDEHGPLGRSLQSLIVDDRAPGGAP